MMSRIARVMEYVQNQQYKLEKITGYFAHTYEQAVTGQIGIREAVNDLRQDLVAMRAVIDSLEKVANSLVK